MSKNEIIVKGARENNLKDISVRIPKKEDNRIYRSIRLWQDIIGI
jgi:excinuclease UvrABC ATPase subunit